MSLANHAIPLLLAQAGLMNAAMYTGQYRWPDIPYRPFIDPLDLHQHWYLFLIPLALGVSIVYKAVRMRDMAGYARAVAIMTVQIIAGMIALGIASHFLFMIFAQFIAARAF